MSNKSISQLNAGSAVSATDLFPDVQTVGVGPVKVTAAQIKTFTSDSPTLVTPNIGVASATSVAINTSGNYSTTISSSGSASLSWTFILPPDKGSAGYSLVTDGNGVSSWDKINLSTSVSGILPVANGGTGLSTFAANRIPYATALDTIGTSASLTFNGTQLSLGAGTAAAPSYVSTSSASTGMYFPAAGSVSLSAGGTERIRIDSAGKFGISTTPLAGIQIIVGGTAPSSGGISYSLQNAQTVPSTSTTSASCYVSGIKTVDEVFTCPLLIHYNATQGTFGASSSVTTQYGFVAQSSLVGATNNYGFYSNVPSGTGRWNFYANGTANNYFGTNVLIGTTTAGASKLVVNDSSVQINLSKTPANASDTGTAGQVCWDASYIYVCVATNTWKRAAIATW